MSHGKPFLLLSWFSLVSCHSNGKLINIVVPDINIYIYIHNIDYSEKRKNWIWQQLINFFFEIVFTILLPQPPECWDHRLAPPLQL
jgi:hypothetical protein